MTNNIKKLLGVNYYADLKKLLKNSICLYSDVAVSAIIITDKGLFKGVNYEDSVLNLGICAERNAIFNAITNGMNDIYEIHILSNLPNIEMCGACRQVAGSFMDPKGKVYTYDLATGKRKVTTFGQLLPKAIYPSVKGEKL